MTPTVEEVIGKVRKTSWWIIRTFRNRTPNFWRFMWMNYLSPIYEYCGPLYFPNSYQNIDALEAGMKSFLKHIPVLQEVHHWDKLRMMNLSSVQRRTERFHIISFWKIINGIIDGPESFKVQEGRRGVTAVLPTWPRGTAPWVVTLRRGSFHYRACLLYNSCPRWVREIKGGTVEGFKRKLNEYLACVPDCPRDSSGGHYPKAYDRDAQTPSNSLVHWGAYLKEKRPGWDW